MATKQRNLFGNNVEKDVILTMPTKKAYNSALTSITYELNKDRMQEIYDAFRKRMPDSDLRIEGNATDVLVDNINYSIKKKQKNKHDYAQILAVILGDEKNLKLYLNSLPEGSLKLFKETVLRIYVPVVEAKKISRLALLGSSYYYSSSQRTDREFAWLSVTNFEYYTYADINYYVYFPPSLYEYFLEVLLPDAYDTINVYTDIKGDEWEYTSFEKNVFTDIPLIDGLFSQGIIEPGSTKPLTASAEKKISQLGIAEFTPKEGFSNMRVHMLACYIASRNRNGYLKKEIRFSSVLEEIEEMVKNRLYESGDFFQICLPYISGIKKSISDYNHLNYLIKYANEFLFTTAGNNSWVPVATLLVHAYSNLSASNGYPIIAYGPNRYNMGLLPKNSLNGDTIVPSEIMCQITDPFILGYLYFLASWGVLELAENKKSKGDGVSPFGQLGFVRLTALGNYVFGLTKTYEIPKEEKKVWFELDDERLIFRSLSDNNPYIVILKDVSNAIGGGRYEVTAESFLSHCSTRDDVEQQIDIFKQYIGHELPQVWKDFFAEMLRHCQPLEKLPVTNYKMYRVSKDNVILQRLLTTDEKLRSLVIRAEGYRILVAKADLAKFENRLKSFGYLL